MKVSRRSLLRTGAAVIAAPAIGTFAPLRPLPAQAQEKQWRHALSLFGDIKYPADFKRFEYVNPAAPKGGVLRLGTFGTFDNLNPVVQGVKGRLAAGVLLVTETLTTGSMDEVSTEYGLLADAVAHPDNHAWVVYRLNPAARWQDGKPVTVEDVMFSFEAYKAHNPFNGSYYRHVVKAEKTGDREITFVFDKPGNRELPLIVGQLNVLAKHWWEGTDGSGRKRDVSQTTLEPFVSSGAYKIGSVAPGRTEVYERVKDYWGKDLNVNVGRDNFDELRYEYYRDVNSLFEGFKGDKVDWRAENSAKSWATSYDFPALRENKVVREEFEMRSRGNMQAFLFNLRREKFKDANLRRAFNFCFDFEETNKTLFYGAYKRISSYFEGTELASSGLPQGKELEILNSVKDLVPPHVFTAAYTNPVNANPQDQLKNRREAMRLFRDAGYEIRDTKLVNARTGEQLSVEFLTDDPNSTRISQAFETGLVKVGINVIIRVVDDAQYQSRVQQFDYDILMGSWPQSLSPGNEQRDFWGSEAADRQGSRNYSGIKNPGIDKLIERLIFATDRDDLVAATRALDRVLMAHYFVVPQWTYPFLRTARWDRFGRPETLPKYGAGGFPTIWWSDPAKLAKLPQRG